MSIVIHGMEMPKKGESGRIAILLGSDGIADVYNFCGTRLGKYICECSAIELPPHGRLGDLDAMLEFVDAGHLRHPHILSWSDRDVEDMIDSRPTIIPADPKEV